MAASVQEVLTELGAWSLPLEYDPELAELLVDGSYMLLWWGEELYYAGIKTDLEPSRDLLTVGGVGVEWALGLDAIGPTIRDRLYVSGRNKLSNGDFVDGDDLWSIDEKSLWVILEGGPALNGDAADDDALTSSEKFDAKEGDLLRLVVNAERVSGAVGRLRARLILPGRFNPPDLFEDRALDVDWENVSEVSGDIDIVDASTMIVGPVTQRQVVQNGSFETGDLTGWIELAIGDYPAWFVNTHPPFPWPAHFGNYVIGAEGPTSIGVARQSRWIEGDPVPGYPPEDSVPVKAGESWRLDGFIIEDTFADADSEAALVAFLIKDTWPAAGSVDYLYTDKVKGNADVPSGFSWKYVKADYDVPGGASPAVTALGYGLFADLNAGGHFYFDGIKLTRTKGNTAVHRLREPIAVTPKRTYRITCKVTGSWPESGPNRQGALELRAKLSGLGRDPVTVVSSALDVSKADTAMLLTVDVTPPSGHDLLDLDFVATDLMGGNVIVGRPQIRLTDTTSVVYDVVIGPGVAGRADYVLDVDAPPGTSQAYGAVVAEQMGGGYKVHSVSLSRREAPSTTAGVVRDLIRKDNGEPTLLEGLIVGDDVIGHDYHVLNLTRRAVLQQVARGGVSLPFREWRTYVDPDLGPMIDFGTPAEIFTDHRDAEHVLLESDFDVITPARLARSSKNIVTDVVVIGADRQSSDGGPPIRMTGEATTGAAVLDWWGRPMERTQTVSEATASHRGFASSLAEYRASLANAPNESLTVRLADWRSRGGFKVGDTLYLYNREKGLEDPSNPMLVEGRSVWPKGYRVTERKLSPGRGFRVEFRPPGRDPIILEGDAVRWEKGTTADLTLGNPAPAALVNDQQGGSAAAQLRKLRASMPA